MNKKRKKKEKENMLIETTINEQANGNGFVKYVSGGRWSQFETMTPKNVQDRLHMIELALHLVNQNN